MTPRETAQSYDALANHWAGEEGPVENGIEQHRRAFAFVWVRSYWVRDSLILFLPKRGGFVHTLAIESNCGY